MTIEILKPEFTILKLNDITDIDFNNEFCFYAKTDKEISLVCPTNLAPASAVVKDGEWRAFRLQGSFDFGLIGILADISTLLAQNKISIFAVSTFNTDYILIKKNNFKKALNLLRSNEYNVIDMK